MPLQLANIYGIPINWQTIKQQVYRLQMRIAKAIREEKQGKGKSLQWILTHSYYEKLLAVKRVTSNKGKDASGVDGITWKTAQEKIRAVKSLPRYKTRDDARLSIFEYIAVFYNQLRLLAPRGICLPINLKGLPNDTEIYAQFLEGQIKNICFSLGLKSRAVWEKHCKE